MDRRYDDDRDDRRIYRSGDWDRGDERDYPGDERRFRERNDRSGRREGWLERTGDRLENWGERAGNRVRDWFDDDDRAERYDRGSRWEREPRGWQSPRESDRRRYDYTEGARDANQRRSWDEIDRNRDWNRPYRREYDMGQRHLESAGYSDRWREDRSEDDRRRNERERTMAGRNRDWREDRDRRERWDEPRGYGRYDNDRGFAERASDEVRSWFGDDEAERRRQLDERYSNRDDRERRYRGEGYRRSGGTHDETWW